MADTIFTSGTTITSDWLNDVNDHVYNPTRTRYLSEWGVVGDGSDETTLIQEAITEMCAAGGGVLMTGPGTFGISSQLTITSGLIIKGVGFGDASTSASQPDAPVSNIVWLGGSGGTDAMLLFKSSTTNEFIYSAGITDIQIKGANAAYNGIRMSSPRRCIIDRLWVERVRNTGLLLDDNNGVLCASNRIGEYSYTAGSNAAAANSHGFVIREETGAGCTGTEAQSLILVTVDGHGLVIGDHDNGYFHKLLTSTSGTGHGVYLRGLTDSQVRVSRKNIFGYLSGDSVYAEAGSMNCAVWINSEGTAVTCEAGAVFDYQVLDRNNGRRWATFKYLVNDYREMPLNEGYAVTGSPVLTTAGGNSARVIAFDSSADEAWQWTIPPPREWSGGKITAVIVEGQKSASAGTGNVVWRLEGLQRTTANNIGGGTLAAETMAAVAADADGTQTLQKFTLTLTTPWTIDAGSHFLFRLTRYAGTSANDTLNQDFHVSSVKLVYVADVGDSDSNGGYRYQVPEDTL